MLDMATLILEVMLKEVVRDKTVTKKGLPGGHAKKVILKKIIRSEVML